MNLDRVAGVTRCVHNQPGQCLMVEEYNGFATKSKLQKDFKQLMIKFLCHTWSNLFKINILLFIKSLVNPIKIVARKVNIAPNYYGKPLKMGHHIVMVLPAILGIHKFARQKIISLLLVVTGTINKQESLVTITNTGASESKFLFLIGSLLTLNTASQ